MITPTLADRIRAAIGPAHAAIEETDYARGMVAGTIGRPAYAAGLWQLAHLHAALEDALADARPASPAVQAVYDPDAMARAGVAEQDLLALGQPEPDPVAAPVAELAGRFADWATTRPAALVGALYVLEGSRMGSMVLARSLPRALGVPSLPGGGLDYHLDELASRPTDWRQFRATVAGLALCDADQDAAVAAATATMDALVEVYAAVPAGVALASA